MTRTIHVCQQYRTANHYNVCSMFEQTIHLHTNHLEIVLCKCQKKAHVLSSWNQSLFFSKKTENETKIQINADCKVLHCQMERFLRIINNDRAIGTDTFHCATVVCVFVARNLFLMQINDVQNWFLLFLIIVSRVLWIYLDVFDFNSCHAYQYRRYA